MFNLVPIRTMLATGLPISIRRGCPTRNRQPAAVIIADHGKAFYVLTLGAPIDQGTRGKWVRCYQAVGSATSPVACSTKYPHYSASLIELFREKYICL